MKRALPILVLLLVLAGVIAFTWRRIGRAGERWPPSRAAELAPMNATAFFHLPDLERTAARWPQSDFNTIAQDLARQPAKDREALQAWLSNALDPDVHLLWRLLPALQKAAPAGLFLAATGHANNPLSKVVGGISYRGKRTDLEAAVRTAKAHFFTRWPGAKSELFTHSGIEIEKISSVEAAPPEVPSSAAWMGRLLSPEPPPEVFLAYRDDWFFFATDRALLTDTLDRYSRKASTPKSLAENTFFAACRKHETPDADFIAWQSSDAGPIGQQAWARLALEWGREADVLRAMCYSARIDGPSRIYLHMAKVPEPSGLANPARPLAAGSFGAITRDAPRAREAPLLRAAWTSKDMNGLVWAATCQELPWAEARAVFDSWILSCGFDPLESFRKLRHHLVVAFEVRDRAQARRFADTIATAEHLKPTQVDAETTQWERPPYSQGAISWPSATLILTKHHLVFGRSHAEVLAFAKRSRQGQPLQPGIIAAASPAVTASVYFDPANLDSMEDSRFFLFPLPAFAEQNRGLKSMKPSLADALVRTPRAGSIRLRSEEQGWLLESDLSILGNYVASRVVLHGQ